MLQAGLVVLVSKARKASIFAQKRGLIARLIDTSGGEMMRQLAQGDAGTTCHHLGSRWRGVAPHATLHFTVHAGVHVTVQALVSQLLGAPLTTALEHAPLLTIPKPSISYSRLVLGMPTP
jgi:hypothetical protein